MHIIAYYTIIDDIIFLLNPAPTKWHQLPKSLFLPFHAPIRRRPPIHTPFEPTLSSRPTFPIQPSPNISSTSNPHNYNNNSLQNAHCCFRERIDALSPLQVCSISNESYPSMKTKSHHGLLTCCRCASERSIHHFSLLNNMDPREKPRVLSCLTQVEEMLISHVNQVVVHARGGQYKYSNHTISFPQDITNIVTSLPRMLLDTDILVVSKRSSNEKNL